ncbi:MAG: hypothetical protein HY286_07005 [Planctomycetes bacterium]|nr:hypothetical protein [Planctomycetota bacterium]
MNANTQPLPSVEKLAEQLLAFVAALPEHDRNFGVDVIFANRDCAWTIERIEFESNLDNPARFYIGHPMARYEAFAIARGMLRNANAQVQS